MVGNPVASARSLDRAFCHATPRGRMGVGMASWRVRRGGKREGTLLEGIGVRE